MIDVKSLLASREEYVSSLRCDLPSITRRVMSASPKRNRVCITRGPQVQNLIKNNDKKIVYKYQNFAVRSNEFINKPVTLNQRIKMRKEMKDYLKISWKVHNKLRCFSPGKLSSNRLLAQKFIKHTPKPQRIHLPTHTPYNNS
ncbi:unnamed protein product [Moneuplotes crassus]|uniref:Uncharacterized protein n=1 Tax=Euplotes crassus TaxID=5936 RepID=A0AAD1UF63_EUPCR|nr:unnamed protein product [Moneuplotes crassus]